MSFEIDIVSDKDIKKEKEKARRLRRTHWWNNKIHNGVCFYCNRELGREQLTMDHVVPLSRGGKSRKGNIVAAASWRMATGQRLLYLAHLRHNQSRREYDLHHEHELGR